MLGDLDLPGLGVRGLGLGVWVWRFQGLTILRAILSCSVVKGTTADHVVATGALIFRTYRDNRFLRLEGLARASIEATSPPLPEESGAGDEVECEAAAAAPRLLRPDGCRV